MIAAATSSETSRAKIPGEVPCVAEARLLEPARLFAVVSWLEPMYTLWNCWSGPTPLPTGT